MQEVAEDAQASPSQIIGALVDGANQKSREALTTEVHDGGKASDLLPRLWRSTAKRAQAALSGSEPEVLWMLLRILQLL